RFDGDALARSYADLAKRGHLAGTKVDAITAALPDWQTHAASPAKEEVSNMVARLPDHIALAREQFQPSDEEPMPDYLALVGRHNPRHLKKKKKRPSR